MLLDIVKKGSTDRSVTLRIIDSTDGTPETGVAYDTSGIDLWYHREGETLTSITEATLASLDAAHSNGGIIHKGNGVYRLDLPDAAFATGANYVDIGGTVTGMIVIGGRVRLVNIDLEDTVRAGLTALPNAAADAAGGLAISDGGGLDLDAIGTNAALAVSGIVSGTAQAGAAGTVTLAAGASATDDIYNGMTVVTTGGTGPGQSRQVYDYNGTTKVASVSPNWQTNPSSDTTYVIVPTPPAPTAAAAVSQVALIDDAITASKFDESTAFPLASADSGATAVARTGADSDTLEILSDEIAALATTLGTPADTDVSTDIAAVKTVADAVQAKTDSLTFTVAGEVDANVQSINDVAITGDGSATPFDV